MLDIKIIIVILLVFLLFCILYLFYNITRGEMENMSASLDDIRFDDNDKIVWTYWENLDENKTPTHISLCLETFKRHLGKYKLIILDQNSIKKYLPDLRDDLNYLMIAQKVDYYRMLLLYKYGGIWLDCDMIVMRDFDEIFEKLDEHDFVGFGCGEINYTPKGKPSNWALASQKNGILVKKCIDIIEKKLNERNILTSIKYYDLGKIIIWQALDELKQDGYDYFHFDPMLYDGSRDINGTWIETTRHFSEEDVPLADESKLFFVFTTNSGINEYVPWVKDAKKEDLLLGKYWISKMFRKALTN